MFSWILLILILAILAILGIWATGKFGVNGAVMDGPEGPSDVRASNRVAVKHGDLDDVRFDVVRNGYRQRQVDEVLVALDKRFQELEEELAAARAMSTPAPDVAAAESPAAAAFVDAAAPSAPAQQAELPEERSDEKPAEPQEKEDRTGTMTVTQTPGAGPSQAGSFIIVDGPSEDERRS
ncbi:hypothetical protein HMPREF2976_03275 [Corynebacterium sp. HMSC077D10]|uniref:hypothetical protein n=1 Tax=unclassified Corynebacterium TaxID=2624378 RepID=UPI0007945290|nr:MULTISPECIES: hypothetical protein [unclassified Corynebacterium]KXB54265.1 DivIVA domain protein [Corynebacterium sp. DNF00584]OFL79557.1 hypothetical protein HMPREF2748_09720 [Corynebacterium sp. HMSC077B05]OFN42380.1 hypothetical protein HMPREF2559_11605 [Corynebacterium sp. HMSC072G08]OFP19869.1 hypothetical protein HMPREF2998_08815 [Corynebacterium sp. HMSC065A05]OFP65098.1 hypothetical protein HMPREF2976_03275 [Corynebacterium sp. HMSC077D10]